MALSFGCHIDLVLVLQDTRLGIILVTLITFPCVDIENVEENVACTMVLI